MSARPLLFIAARLLPLVVIALAGTRALAQDPPSRVGRLNHMQGTVVFAPAGDNEWIDAEGNRPLTRGDRIWTDRGARAELQVGSSAVRMDGQTRLEIAALDDASTQLTLTQGSVYVRVRSLPEGENFEVDTPNLAWRAAYPGDYRIDVDAANATTRVTVHSGTGAVYGEGGEALPLGGGQQIMFRGRTLAQVTVQESPPQDNFDRWASERNRREDQSVSARRVPREVVGYQQLDSAGQWQHDATYGDVWMPLSMPANWAPYRNGHWDWIAPWGWTWVDDASWGFAPFHYGRWAMVGTRWAWVPGRLELRPVYAPALVAFVGAEDGGSMNLNFMRGGKPGIAWFPLAPGESWLPGYKASATYLAAINRDTEAQVTYAFQRKAEAVTAISNEDFHRGRPAKAGWLRLAADTMGSAQVVPPPPRPERREAVAHETGAREKKAQDVKIAAASSPAPAKLVVQPVQPVPPVAVAPAAVAAMVPAPLPAPAAAPAPPARAPEAVAKAEPAPKAEPVAKMEPVAKAAPAAKTEVAAKPAPDAAKMEAAKAEALRKAETARVASAQRKAAEQQKQEQARQEQQAKQAELAKREAQAARDAQSRREQAAAQARREQVARREEARRQLQAKREQAHREQVAHAEQLLKQEQARRAEQTKREAVAKRQEQARRDAVAKREEQQRLELHAQHVEQARKAADHDAQVLHAQREEQARREAERVAQREQQQREQSARDQAQRELAQREQAQREFAQRQASMRQQQALAEQLRRDREAAERQRRDRLLGRPDLRDTRSLSPDSRAIPILNPQPVS